MSAPGFRRLARRAGAITGLRPRRARSGPPDPPPVAPGDVVGPPDFVGVGTQKSGTSWWYSQIVAHPQCHRVPGQPKERHYFDRFWGHELDDAGVEAYHRLFPRPPGTRVGEWTPRYVHDFWTAPLLARAAPDGRFLVMLRDPVDRFQSGIAHWQRLEPDLGPGSRPTPERRRRQATAADDELHRSMYHRQISRFLRSVPRDQLLVLQFERCVADPARWYRRTLEFLGLRDAGFVPETLRRVANRTTGEKPSLPRHVVEQVVADLADDVRDLAADFEEDVDVSLWPHFASR